MAVLCLLFFLIGTAIAQNSSNGSTTATTPPASAAPLLQNKLNSSVFKVSPLDIANNTSKYMRSDSGLNRILALSNPPNLHTSDGLDAELKKTLSIDNLANQLGVTEVEPNLLGNFNNLPTNVPAADARQNNLLDLNALQSQAVNDYLGANGLGSQSVNSYQVNPLVQNFGSAKLQSLTSELTSPNQYTFTKLYKSPVYTTLLTDTDNDDLSKAFKLLNQQAQSQNLGNVYQQPNQYSALLTDTNNAQLINSVPNLSQSAASSLSSVYEPTNQIQTLVTNNDQSNLLQTLLGQQSQVSDQPVLEINTSLNTNQPLDLQPLLSRQSDQTNIPISNILQTFQPDPLQVNPYDSLSSIFQPVNNKPVTQVVFKDQIPNIGNQYCKSAFGALLQKAYAQYLKLATSPFCQQSGTNPYPSSNWPFEIIVVPSKPNEQSNTNSFLTKLVWYLLNRLKNSQNVPNQSDSMWELLPNGPDLQPDIINTIPDPTPTPNVNTLILLLNLLKNPNQNPLRLQYLYKIIMNILNKNSPSNEFSFDEIIDLNPLPDSIDTPDFPSPVPSPYPEGIPDLSNPRVKYVILVLKKYLPEQQFSMPDISFLVNLVNTLPRNLNDLILNQQLLKQVILQLRLRHLNPKEVLAIIYNHILQNLPDTSNFVNPEMSSRVVVLKYLVKRQPPFVYKPYYYVLYKLPYVNFVNHLYQLLLAKPYLKQNRAQLLKELLVLAVSNNNPISSDFNGVSKDYLVQLIANQGATPLDVKIVNDDNVINEQLKVINDLNTQLGTDSTLSQLGTNSFISQVGGNSFGLIGGSSGSNSWQYLLNQISGLTKSPLNSADVTNVNPFVQILGTPRKSLQTNEPLSLQQDVVGAVKL